jgi:hypothetical protein
MSTPAAAALSGAGGPPAGGAPGGAPAAGAPGGGAGAGAGAPATAFYDAIIPASDATKETREWLSTKGFKDGAALVTSYRDTERMANDLRQAANLKGYPVATVDPATGQTKPADANQLKAWDAAMGVPATADKYDFGDLSKVAGVDPHFVQMLGIELHGVHTPAALATAQAAAYERAVAKHVAYLLQRENEQSAAALKELEVAWGANYQERVALGKRAQAFLGREIGGITDEQWRGLEGLFGTAKMMSFFWKIGAGNIEAKFPGGDGGGAPAFDGGTTQLQARYEQLQADRAAGKISTDAYRKQEKELADQIAAGFATPAGGVN